MDLTAKAINDIILNQPENIFLIDSNVLVKMVQDDNEKIACLVELVVRYLLNNDKTLRTTLESFLTKQRLREIERKFKGVLPQDNPILSNIETIWDSTDCFSKELHYELKKRLGGFFGKTDGFIPIYNSDSHEGFFLPFQLKKLNDSNRDLPVVCDTSGKEIRNWASLYKRYLPNVPYRCIVRCQTDGRHKYLPPLTGSSFTLSVYMAYLHKEEKVFYNPLRLVATGAVDSDDISAVEIDDKIEAFQKTFNTHNYAYFIFPEKFSQKTDNKPYLKAIPIGTDLIEFENKLRKLTESLALGVPSLDYAWKRLQELYAVEANHETTTKWTQMMVQVENLEKTIFTGDYEKQLIVLMLKGVICCHAGKTQDARMWNTKAKKLARQCNKQKELLRLSVEELVMLQDIEDFHSIAELSQTLGDDIEKFGDSDLKMRYNGTMGQAHAYGYLSEIQGYEKEKSKQFLQKAIQNAIETKSPADIIKDKNYLHLWHALFCPGSPEEERVYNDVEENITHWLKDFPKKRETNRKYLGRQKAFALYRDYLQTGKLPDDESLLYKIDCSDEEDWISAITRKYLATIYAAKGDYQMAEEYFKWCITNGIPKIQDEIIYIIRLTICGQSIHSLKNHIKDITFFQKEFDDTIKILQNSKSPQVQAWEDFIDKDCRGPHPGLKYWY